MTLLLHNPERNVNQVLVYRPQANSSGRREECHARACNTQQFTVENHDQHIVMKDRARSKERQNSKRIHAMIAVREKRAIHIESP